MWQEGDPGEHVYFIVSGGCHVKMKLATTKIDEADANGGKLQLGVDNRVLRLNDSSAHVWEEYSEGGTVFKQGKFIEFASLGPCAMFGEEVLRVKRRQTTIQTGSQEMRCVRIHRDALLKTVDAPTLGVFLDRIDNSERIRNTHETVLESQLDTSFMIPHKFHFFTQPDRPLPDTSVTAKDPFSKPGSAPTLQSLSSLRPKNSFSPQQKLEPQARSPTAVIKTKTSGKQIPTAKVLHSMSRSQQAKNIKVIEEVRRAVKNSYTASSLQYNRDRKLAKEQLALQLKEAQELIDGRVESKKKVFAQSGHNSSNWVYDFLLGKKPSSTRRAVHAKSPKKPRQKPSTKGKTDSPGLTKMLKSQLYSPILHTTKTKPRRVSRKQAAVKPRPLYVHTNPFDRMKYFEKQLSKQRCSHSICFSNGSLVTQHWVRSTGLRAFFRLDSPVLKKWGSCQKYGEEDPLRVHCHLLEVQLRAKRKKTATISPQLLHGGSALKLQISARSLRRKCLSKRSGDKSPTSRARWLQSMRVTCQMIFLNLILTTKIITTPGTDQERALMKKVDF